jgi:hypothetical protein
VFDVLTGAGLFEFAVSFVAICAIISFLARRKDAHETRSLQKENHRLRNIVANLMIDNAQIRDSR